MKTARILVIEDTPVNLELVVDLLESAGHTVFTAEAAEPGITLARENQPDLILMDIGLPGTDGLAATRALKQDPATCHIPVVALTAHALPSDEQDARAAGCSGYLTKPIDTHTFLESVSSVIESRHNALESPS